MEFPIYGCLFNKLTYFICDNISYKGKNIESSVLCSLEEHELLKKIISYRINSIKQPGIIGPNINTLYELESTLYELNSTLTGGVGDNFKKVSKVSKASKASKVSKASNVSKKSIIDIFNIPTCDIKIFYELLASQERGYLTSTRSVNEVFAIYLCFYHIDDFDISNLSGLFTKSQKSFIITEQKSIDDANYKKTINDIENNKQIFPVYIDAEYLYDSRSESLERKLFLSDGNHRIVALKKLKYNGYVPSIVCDYLSYNL